MSQLPPFGVGVVLVHLGVYAAVLLNHPVSAAIFAMFYLGSRVVALLSVYVFARI